MSNELALFQSSSAPVIGGRDGRARVHATGENVVQLTVALVSWIQGSLHGDAFAKGVDLIVDRRGMSEAAMMHLIRLAHMVCPSGLEVFGALECRDASVAGVKIHSGIYCDREKILAGCDVRPCVGVAIVERIDGDEDGMCTVTVVIEWSKAHFNDIRKMVRSSCPSSEWFAYLMCEPEDELDGTIRKSCAANAWAGPPEVVATTKNPGDDEEEDDEEEEEDEESSAPYIHVYCGAVSVEDEMPTHGRAFRSNLSRAIDRIIRRSARRSTATYSPKGRTTSSSRSSSSS